MAHSYTPGLQVTESTTVIKNRTLPIPGKVNVRKGDIVKADNIIATTALPNEVVPINILNQLGITPEEVHDHMLKKEGDSVKKDEPMAENKPLIKWFKKTIKSPIDGTVESVSNITGQVMLRKPPRHVELLSYIDGEVDEVHENVGADVKTEASFIQGIFGIGGETFGQLELVVNGPEDEITENIINSSHKDKIIIGGSFIGEQALKKAADLGVKGIIVGGFDARDLKSILGYELGVAITGDENISFTLIITEGFGKIRMADRTFNLLSKKSGRRASISGRTQIRAGVMRPEIIIPITESEKASITVEHSNVSSGMSVGDEIRVIREPYFGKLGIVKALPPELQIVDSGAKVRVLEVELANGETAIIPRANVELIER